MWLIFKLNIIHVCFIFFCQSALRISRDLTYHWWKDRSKKRVRNKNRVQHSPLLFGGSGPAIYEFSYFGSSSVCFATDYWLTVNFRYIFTKKRCTTPKKNRENKKKIRSKVGTQTFPGSPESDQPKWIKNPISTHHHFHVMWGTLFGRFGLLGSLCSNKAAADSRWFQGAGCRLPLTTHPSKPEVRRSKGLMGVFQAKLHGISRFSSVSTGQSWRYISIIWTTGSFFDCNIFFSMQELEKTFNDFFHKFIKNQVWSSSMYGSHGSLTPKIWHTIYQSEHHGFPKQ